VLVAPSHMPLFTQSSCLRLLTHNVYGAVYCVDAKLLFDDNASFRQKELFTMRDYSMEDAREVAASQFNLNYVGLDGNIGCMGTYRPHHTLVDLLDADAC